jgi:hypothetical protein
VKIPACDAGQIKNIRVNPPDPPNPRSSGKFAKLEKLNREETMKYLCLGYMAEKAWDAMSKSEQEDFMVECLAYDEELRKNGYLMGGEALQSVRTATTLRYKNGRVSITDGPFAETNEQLGGIMVLEARDLNHAIQLMSQHPSIRMGGCWEIRPTEVLPSVNELKSHQS